MNRFLDTSVLVPVFYGDHIHHRASLDLFIQFDKSTGCCGAHSLVVYSTLTRMPGKHRIGSEQAILFIGIAHCALKAKAEAIYTWNERHYALCGADVAAKLRTPCY